MHTVLDMYIHKKYTMFRIKTEDIISSLFSLTVSDINRYTYYFFEVVQDFHVFLVMLAAG